MMFTIQFLLLVLIGLIGIICNWLLILAIQRKTYHHHYESHRIPTPTINLSLLQQPSASMSGQVVIRPPLLPPARSSISTFDKYILAFLVNDILVCNFLIPLRLLDLSQGLPCVFLCFIYKFFERLTAIIEIILLNLLLMTSLLFFYRKRLATSNLYLLYLVIMTPLIIIYLATTLTHLDVHEYEYQQRPPSCKQIFTYINITTYRTLNILCCLMTYLIILLQFGLLIRMKWAIKKFKRTSLKTITETAALTRTAQQEITGFDQNNRFHTSRRSMYSPSIHNVSNTTSIAADLTPTTQRSFPPFDYLTYLTIIETSHTLVKSTYLLLVIYLVVYLPYWINELSLFPLVNKFKDLYLLAHILKPFCYMLTNEKYRYHVLAILQCKPFRMLPMLLRRKSRVITL